MGEDHRPFSDLEGAVESARAHVGQIDDHAQSVHFPDQGLAEVRKTHPAARFQAAVGGLAAAIVGEPDGAHPQLVQHAQHVQTALDHIGVLDRRQRAGVSGRPGLLDIVDTAHDDDLFAGPIDVV